MHWAVEFVEVHREPLLRGLSFAVPVLGLTAVVGRGEGTTELMFRMVAGLEGPTDGAVIVFGQDMSRSSAGERMRLQRRLATVFGGPDHALFAGLTARENIAAVVRTAGRVGKRGERAVVDEALYHLDLFGVADAHPDALAPAHRKRLALARGIALNSPLLVVEAFDRESDPRDVAELADIVRADRIRRGGAALLFMDDPDLAAHISDEVVRLT